MQQNLCGKLSDCIGPRLLPCFVILFIHSFILLLFRSILSGEANIPVHASSALNPDAMTPSVPKPQGRPRQRQLSTSTSSSHSDPLAASRPSSEQGVRQSALPSPAPSQIVLQSTTRRAVAARQSKDKRDVLELLSTIAPFQSDSSLNR